MALKVKADAIITRDKDGFARSSIKIRDRDELFEELAARGIDYAEAAGAFG